MTESITFASESLGSGAQPALDIWLERCLAGEELAHVEVYNQYALMVYRLCYSLLRHKEDAEEVLQDSFEYAFRKLGSYDPNKASFKTWLYQIAVSRCRNKRRRKWLKTTPISGLVGERIADENVTDPDDSLVFSERQRIVWDALGNLSPKLRETAILRHYEGMTYGQIGNILNIPPKTAESRMRLAHKALREMLAKEFGYQDEGRQYEER